MEGVGSLVLSLKVSTGRVGPGVRKSISLGTASVIGHRRLAVTGCTRIGSPKGTVAVTVDVAAIAARGDSCPAGVFWSTEGCVHEVGNWSRSSDDTVTILVVAYGVTVNTVHGIGTGPIVISCRIKKNTRRWCGNRRHSANHVYVVPNGVPVRIVAIEAANVNIAKAGGMGRLASVAG
jgi:hypothetical protein